MSKARQLELISLLFHWRLGQTSNRMGIAASVLGLGKASLGTHVVTLLEQ